MGPEDAIAFAAKSAGIKSGDMKVLYYPLAKEDKITKLLESLNTEDSKSIKSMQKMPEAMVKGYEVLRKLESYQGIQMRMPFDIEMK